MTTDATIRLHRFADLLLRWNATLNLIAVKDAAVIWERHIADSLQLVPLMPPGTERPFWKPPPLPPCIIAGLKTLGCPPRV